MPSVLQRRRTPVLTAPVAAVAGSLLLVGLLAGCGAGFGATSVQPYPPSDGLLANSGDLRVQNILVVAAEGSATGVVSTAIANRGTREDRLTGITSPQGTVDLTGDGILAPGASLTLGSGTATAATVTGLTAEPGREVMLRLTFARAEPVTVRTVVVPASGFYSSLTPAPTTP